MHDRTPDALDVFAGEFLREVADELEAILPAMRELLARADAALSTVTTDPWGPDGPGDAARVFEAVLELQRAGAAATGGQP